MRVIQNVLFLFQKEGAIAEHFCYGNTLLILIKLEKLIQISVLNSLCVKCTTNLKSE